MKAVLLVIHLIITVALITSILLQVKGVGLSATFGGEGSFYRSRRGVERLLVYSTVILASLFAITSILNLFT